MKSSGVCVLICCALRRPDRFAATVSIRQRQVAPGKDARFLSKLRRLLGKSDEQHRKLILQLAQTPNASSPLCGMKSPCTPPCCSRTSKLIVGKAEDVPVCELRFRFLLPEVHSTKCRSSSVTEERKFAILFAATILAARRLIDMDPNKPNMAKRFFVDRAIEDAAFILERIDKKWPTIVNSFSVKQS